ncbi:hypothetical protein [Bradyrhizobium sp. 150]|uniref:hypothetical protein n=1 Tax=Bradyrhizobium sp. 150 TaxID=2782625 RepID=UPI001FF8C06E|nr:hypothetical protein [Bradyrhizobium sp. 150]MCK1670286.1 hypothetical protein [Bradyrhizobium sp. 150]
MRLMATEAFTYGRRRLRAGDSFEPDNAGQGELLKRVGRAREIAPERPAAAPAVAAAVVSEDDELTPQRGQYYLRSKGQPADGRSKADRLRNETNDAGRYQRRDMRAED